MVFCGSRDWFDYHKADQAAIVHAQRAAVHAELNSCKEACGKDYQDPSVEAYHAVQVGSAYQLYALWARRIRSWRRWKRGISLHTCGRLKESGLGCDVLVYWQRRLLRLSD